MDQILGLIDVFWEHLQNGTLPEWSYGNYLVLLVLVIVEGPIVTLLGAAAASAGLMRLPLVFLTVAAGNLIADIGWYCLGYFSKESTLLRYGRWLGLRRRHLARLRWGMRTYARRILLVAKFSTGFIVPTLVAAGLARVPVRRWFPIVFAGEMFWTTLLVLIGFYATEAIKRVEVGLHYLALGGFVVLVVLIIFLSHRAGRSMQAFEAGKDEDQPEDAGPPAEAADRDAVDTAHRQNGARRARKHEKTD